MFYLIVYHQYLKERAVNRMYCHKHCSLLSTSRKLQQVKMQFMPTKVAAKNMRYLARIKFSRSLDHKKMFGLIWQVVFKLETYFFKWVGYIFWVWMNSAKSHERQLFFVILETNHNQTLIWLWLLGNVVHWSNFKARSRDTLFSWTFDLYIYFKENNPPNICLFNMNFFAKIINGYKDEFKTLSNVWDGAPQVITSYRETSEFCQTFMMEFLFFYRLWLIWKM